MVLPMASQGLYLCGASTRMGHGIGGVTLSGLYAAATLAGRDLVHQTLGAASQTSSVLAR